MLAFFGDLGVNIVGGLLAAALLAGGSWLVATKRGGWVSRRALRAGNAQLGTENAQLQARAVQVSTENAQLQAENVQLRTEIARQEREDVIVLGYMAHLRDVGQALRRAQFEDGRKVGDRVRHDILEAIRGFIPTQPGEHLKVAWFRPDEQQRELAIYREVGHDEEVVRTLRLRIGAGIAGSAFNDATTISLGDMAADKRFKELKGGENSGAIICTPILRGQEATGVLSVLSTRKDAFGLLETSYMEALAACIAALEALERPVPPAHTGE